MIVTTIDVDDALAQEFFTYAGYKARRVREPLFIIGARTRTMINRQFESEGRYMLGTKWYRLNPDYREEKLRDGYPDTILVRDRKLVRAAISPRAFKARGSSGIGELVYEVRRPADKDPDVDVAELHMEGRASSANHKMEMTGGMPARPFFVDTPEWYDMIEDVFVDWLDKLNRSNRRRSADLDRPTITPNIMVAPIGDTWEDLQMGWENR